MEEKRKAIKRKNAVSIVIIIIAFALWIGIPIVTAKINLEFAIIFFLLFGGMVLVPLTTKSESGLQDDKRIMQEAENLEKAEQILWRSVYTPIICTINTDGIQGGWQRVEVLRNIVSTQAEVLEKFNLTLAAKLNEDKICYAIVDENGIEISKVDMYDTATFFMNNFEKI